MFIAKFQGKGLENLGRINRNFSSAIGRALFKVSLVGEKEIKKEIIKKKLIWKIRLYNSIKAKKISNKESVIKAVNYAEAIDRARPHYVSLKRGRKIYQWTREKLGSKVKTVLSFVRYTKRGGIKGAIYVTPTPFIDTAMNRTLRKSKRIIEQGLNRYLISRGRAITT